MTGIESDRQTAETRFARNYMRVLLPLFFAVAVLYAAKMPAWLNSDEPFHYIYIQKILNERRLPTHEETYQATHPPVYYAAAAAWGIPYRNAPSETQNKWLRLLSAFFGVLTIYIIYRIGRDALNDPLLGAGMALFAAANPAFVVMNSVVNNDPAAILACTGTIYLILMLNRDGGGPWKSAMCGAAAGFCCLVKINANLIPVFFLFFYALHPKNRKRKLTAVSYDVFLFFFVFTAFASIWFVSGYLMIGNKMFFNPVVELIPNFLHVPANFLWFAKSHMINFWIPQDYLRGFPKILPFGTKLFYFLLSAFCALIAAYGLAATRRIQSVFVKHAIFSFYFCFIVYFAQMAVYNTQFPVSQARYAYIIIAPIAAATIAPSKSISGNRFSILLIILGLAALAIHLVWALIFMASIGPMLFSV